MQQYAEALRKSLMEGLFEGNDLEVDGDDVAAGSKAVLTAGDVNKLLDVSAGTAGGAAAGQAAVLADLGAELEQLSGHEIIKNIMDQVSVVYTGFLSTPAQQQDRICHASCTACAAARICIFGAGDFCVVRRSSAFL